MRATIAKEFSFDAAHRLPNHDGKCQRLHGHTYRFRVMIAGEVQALGSGAEEGMVQDFGRVTAAWKNIEPRLDHQYLNQTLPGIQDCPTAERLAAWLLSAFGAVLVGVQGIALWETPTSYVIVSAQDVSADEQSVFLGYVEDTL